MTTDKTDKTDKADTTTGRLGAYGESLAIQRITARGWSVTKDFASSGKAHKIDYLIRRGDTEIYMEVKTHARLIAYPATGYDTRDADRYKDYTYGNRVYIIWVDSALGMIYGGELAKLEPHVFPVPRGKKEPTIAYPLCFMREIDRLTEEEIKELKRLEEIVQKERYMEDLDTANREGLESIFGSLSLTENLDNT